jgi:hypothetical protein
MLAHLIHALADTTADGAGGAGLFAGMGAVVILFWIIGIALTFFWIWMVIDAATSNMQGNEKVVWVLVVVLLGWLGALIYFFAKRAGVRGVRTVT